MRLDSYVYKHINKNTNECFYVGVGSSKNYERAFSKLNRNNYWHNYINKHGGYEVLIYKDNLTKEQACEIEIKLIKEIGRRIDNTGTLVNLSTGGENSLYGIIRTKEHQEKINQSNRGKKRSEEVKKKQSLLKLGKNITEEHKKNISKGLKGIKRTDEQKLRYSLSKKGIKRPKQTKEHIEKRRLSGCFNGSKKKIICLNNNKIYSSAKEAAMELNISDKHIGSVCNGNRTQTHGYKFKHY